MRPGDLVSHHDGLRFSSVATVSIQQVYGLVCLFPVAGPAPGHNDSDGEGVRITDLWVKYRAQLDHRVQGAGRVTQIVLIIGTQ